MNVNMWENRILQKNIKELQSLGYFFVDPGYGALACGEYGKGRFADPENILDEMISIMSQKDFSGRRVLVTAGPTREPIDPVRFISNPSSGKMGFSIARALIRRGAAVKLISGPTYLSPPRNMDFISVATAKEMASAVWDNFEWSDIVIMTSAVADFRPRKAESQKIKKNDHCLVLEMEKTSDILKTIGKKKGKRIIVGFAAETNDLIANAVVKLKKKKLDMIVANDVSTTDIGFGSEQNKVKIILSDGSIEDVPKMEKDEVAEKILDKIAYLVAERKALF
jgi:phosphopantothenoylcysteine decarboxylase/phosphopantothenate--cysteine ligase